MEGDLRQMWGKILCSVLAATAAVLVGCSGSAGAPPASVLPEGRLLMFSGNQHAANFIDQDHTAKAGSRADVWLLTVLVEPFHLDSSNNPAKQVVEYTTHVIIACANPRTVTELSTDGFNAAGGRSVWLPPKPAMAIDARSEYDFLAQVMCDGVRPPPGQGAVVIGHHAAIQETHAMLGGPSI